jgi:hypothetical protein
LNRESELAEPLRNEVSRHADRCPECAAELARINNTQKAFDSLRNAEPVLENPRELTTAIMHRVLSRDERARWPVLSFPVFMSSRLQRAVQFACILLVAGFFLQSILDARRMAALDERLVQIRPPGARRGDLLPQSAAEAEEMFHTLSAGIGPFGGNLRIGPLQQETLMDRLKNKYPALFTVTVDDGLDKRKRVILATEGRAFLNEVELLVRLGETSHEH